MQKALLDTDILSALLKQDSTATHQARIYLSSQPRLTISAMTRFEILRGLAAKQADKQMAAFATMCAAIEVHKHFGPGLLESAYEVRLCFELAQRDLSFERQVSLPIEYKQVKLSSNYLLDLVVEDQVVIELKSVETILPVHEDQLLSYLKLSGKRIGLLLNFNVKLIQDGITRRVL